MVIALVIFSFIIFILLDFLLNKKEKAEKIEQIQKAIPIFLSPQKALIPTGKDEEKHFHISHTWALPADSSQVYVGFDDFVSQVFTDTIKLKNLPLVGSYVSQGEKIWELSLNGHSVSQLSPVSGKVAKINPSCNAGLPLETDQLAKSWILKFDAENLAKDKNNLMRPSQAKILNKELYDELIMLAQEDHFLNDGGKVDPAYLKKLPDEKWREIVEKFFPFDN